MGHEGRLKALGIHRGNFLHTAAAGTAVQALGERCTRMETAQHKMGYFLIVAMGKYLEDLHGWRSTQSCEHQDPMELSWHPPTSGI